MQPHTEYTYKIVILGYFSVGKSCLVLKYVRGEFNENEESTIGAAFITKTIFSKGQQIKYEIWDTAGQERYNSLIPMYYRGAHVALVVYDITKRESYETALKWIEELKNEKPANFLKVLIGNKIDLENRRVVSFSEGQSYADANACLFYETSAKSGLNVEKIFKDISDILPRMEKRNRSMISISGPEKNFSCC